jgi:hypothetical protein
MNLELGTSHQTEITEQWIGGPLDDLLRFATFIERSVQANVVGTRIALRANFSPLAPYELVLDVRDESFDPASVDPTCC